MVQKSYLLLLIIIGIAVKGYAHESRPLFIELTEQESNIYLLQYKIPSSIPSNNSPEVIMSTEFKELGALATYSVAQGQLRSQQFMSGESINGKEIIINYPINNPAVSSIIKLYMLDGSQFQTVLGPEQLSWTIPEKESFWKVAWQYCLLGISHILIGWDHLLFLICLVLVAGTGRKLLITITGFTLAHSLTLVLSALEVITVPVPPVEAVIALSVVFLASELAINDRDSLTFKYPISVSSSFGLLHGFGFAAVLGEIGLPQKEVLSSLLFFNVGVELGQLLFMVIIISVFYLFRIILNWMGKESFIETWAPSIKKAIVYGVGCIASYWMVERVAGFVLG